MPTGVQVLIAILRAAPQQGVLAMAGILPAAVSKLASASSSPLIVALLSVFAQLVLTNAVQLIDYLAAAPSPGRLILSQRRSATSLQVCHQPVVQQAANLCLQLVRAVRWTSCFKFGRSAHLSSEACTTLSCPPARLLRC